MGRFVIRAAWRTDYEDEGWEQELKKRIRQGLVDRGHHPIGDFSVELLQADATTSEVVKFYSATVEVAGDNEGFIDLSRLTVKRPAVAGPHPEWVGLLDANKAEIDADWYERQRRDPKGVEFEVPAEAEQCSVAYVGEYMEQEGGAALRIRPVDAGGRSVVLKPDTLFYTS